MGPPENGREGVQREALWQVATSSPGQGVIWKARAVGHPCGSPQSEEKQAQRNPWAATTASVSLDGGGVAATRAMV